MRVNEIVEIVNGHLLNQPQISYFENIATEIDRVVRGSLFIAIQKKGVKRAIELGAYGILFEDGDLDLIDEECAWIRVDSLQDAITRLIRYRLLSRNISILYLKNIEFEIAQEILTDPRVYFLSTTKQDNHSHSAIHQNVGVKESLLREFGEFLEVTQKQGVQKIIISNQNLLDIPLDYTQAIIPENEPFKIISCTLFDSKIYFDSKRYTLTLPSIFLGYLSSVITLFLNEEIYFSLDNFESISHLKPIFITSKNVLCPYGQSGRVLLAERGVEHFKYYADYIIENAKWAKTRLFVPEEKQSTFPQAVSYKNQNLLLESIKEEKFNFALILGIDSGSLLECLPSSTTEMSLFDE